MGHALSSLSKTFDEGTDMGDVLEWLLDNIETDLPDDPSELTRIKPKIRIQVYVLQPGPGQLKKGERAARWKNYVKKADREKEKL